MVIPKKKYRDKVRERLNVVHNLFFGDSVKLEKLLRRLGEFGKGSDFHNKQETLRRLLEVDVPEWTNNDTNKS
jgi:hypothetical protein